MASEVGVIDIDPAKVVTKGRLQPGRMFLIDTAAGPHRRRRGDQDDARRRAPVRRVARGEPRRARRPAAARARRVQPRQRAAPPAAVRLHPRGAQGHPRPDGRQGHRADRVDGHRHADRRAVVAAAPAVRLLLAALRPGHQPAARRHPRGGRHVGVARRSGPRTTCCGPSAGELPPARAAVPDHRQRRAGQDRPRQRRRPVPRPAVARRQGPLPRRRRRPRARAGAVGDLLARCRRPSRTAPASSCCRTATPTPSRRRSRRCC